MAKSKDDPKPKKGTVKIKNNGVELPNEKLVGINAMLNKMKSSGILDQDSFGRDFGIIDAGFFEPKDAKPVNGMKVLQAIGADGKPVPEKEAYQAYCKMSPDGDVVVFVTANKCAKTTVHKDKDDNPNGFTEYDEYRKDKDGNVEAVHISKFEDQVLSYEKYPATIVGQQKTYTADKLKEYKDKYSKLSDIQDREIHKFPESKRDDIIRLLKDKGIDLSKSHINAEEAAMAGMDLSNATILTQYGHNSFKAYTGVFDRVAGVYDSEKEPAQIYALKRTPAPKAKPGETPQKPKVSLISYRRIKDKDGKFKYIDMDQVQLSKDGKSLELTELTYEEVLEQLKEKGYDYNSQVDKARGIIDKEMQGIVPNSLQPEMDHVMELYGKAAQEQHEDSRSDDGDLTI